jgi:hypothetical protein
MLKFISKCSLWFLIAISLTISLVSLRTEYSNSSPNTPRIWVQDSLEHIMLDEHPQDVSNIHLYAARGEYESFQIAINAPKDDFTVANVEISDLKGFGDRVLSKSDITLYREHYVEVTKPSPTWGGTKVKPLGKGWYPDGLIPFVDPQTGVDLVGAELDAIPFKLKKGFNQTIWVDIFVSRDTPSGDYQGIYTVNSNLGKVSGKILLTVWNFELPEKPSLKSAFLSWEQNDKNTLIELLPCVFPFGVEPIIAPVLWHQRLKQQQFARKD